MAGMPNSKYIYTTKLGTKIELDHKLSFSEKMEIYPAWKRIIINYAVYALAALATYLILFIAYPLKMPEAFTAHPDAGPLMGYITLIAVFIVLIMSYGNPLAVIFYCAVLTGLILAFSSAKGYYGIYPLIHGNFSIELLKSDIHELNPLWVSVLAVFIAYYVVCTCQIYKRIKRARIPELWEKNTFFHKLAVSHYGEEDYYTRLNSRKRRLRPEQIKLFRQGKGIASVTVVPAVPVTNGTAENNTYSGYSGYTSYNVNNSYTGYTESTGNNMPDAYTEYTGASGTGETAWTAELAEGTEYTGSAESTAEQGSNPEQHGVWLNGEKID